jgi:signal transduction histidine kinase
MGPFPVSVARPPPAGARDLEWRHRKTDEAAMMSFLNPDPLDTVEQDALARRYVWRATWPLLLVGSIVPLLVIMLLFLPHQLRSSGSPAWIVPVLVGALSPVLGLTSIARGQLARLREQGVVLTADLISADATREFVSPLDPFSTFDLCADRLSSIGLAEALGFARPAAFRYDPFGGRITIGRLRPFWCGGAVVVTAVQQGSGLTTVRIERRPGLRRFLPKLGEAAAIVDKVKAELQGALGTRRASMDAAVRAQELERTVLQARLHAMQAQVEPHFLYNTLANLKYLIRTDAQRAGSMVDHLVGYFQAALPDMRTESSSVGREIDLAEHYLSIMRIRMGDRLRFTIDVDPAVLDHPAPPAMLISLVENAVKHGLERADRPVTIAVACAAEHGCVTLSVRDDGVGLGLDDAQAGTGIGLANIHQRLRLLYGTRASLRVEPAQPRGVLAVLRIPLETMGKG